MFVLRQSTSADVLIGPFVDSTDGNTVESGLTIANTDIRLSKNGANIVAKNSGGGTHDELGYYTITLDATDTNTVGRLQLLVHASGALPVYHEFQVIEEAVYDADWVASATGLRTANVTQFGGSNGTFASGRPEVNLSHIAGSAVSTTTAQLGVNVVQVSGDANAADNLETAFDDTAGAVPWQGIIDQGTAQSATATTLVLRAGAAFADDEIIGSTIVITGGSAGVGQARAITDYVGATDTATVDTWTTTPSGTITYKIYGTAASSGGGGGGDATEAKQDTIIALLGTPADDLAADIAAVKTVVDAVLVDTGTTLDGKIDTIDTNVDAILVDTGTTLDGKINTIDTVVDAVKAVTDLLPDSGALTSLATAANLTTVDTVVDAIKAKTDSLTFTVAGVVDSNIQRINDVAITGDGQTGTEFNVA